MKQISIIMKNYFFIMFIPLIISLPLNLNGEKKEDKKDKKILIEEIEITGKVPSQQPVSTVSNVNKKKLEQTASKNLSEIFPSVPGVHVTEGEKGEAGINIRGLSSNRITLMIDGVPIDEPYFNTFDLKSFSSSEIERIKIIKGSSSVLYGPNTLGGIINIISRRPDKPFFGFDANLSDNNTFFLSGSGGYQKNNLSFLANFNWDRSDGYEWRDDNTRQTRKWSNYNRRNFSARIYYSPTDKSEIVGEIFYTNSEYRIPTALDYYKERYWHFRDWDRIQVSLGSILPIGERGFFKLRTYLVHHFNVLDNYKDPQMENIAWESTYKNYSAGLSGLAEYSTGDNNLLKFSVNSGFNGVNTQSDINEEWEKYRRNIYSIAFEDHWSISEKIQLIGGFSVDILNKDSGDSVSAVNPLIGFKFSTAEYSSFYFSYARKSRFPSMKSLYSGSSGNPDLIEELGNSAEAGFRYNRKFNFSAAVFYNFFNDMIQDYRGTDGYKTYRNIGSATIKGFEVEGGKNFGLFDIMVSYTYLHSNEEQLNLPLDYTPENQFNFFMTIGPLRGFSLNIWGKNVSESFAKLGKEPPFESISIPGYFVINFTFEKFFKGHSIYLKVSNVFDSVYFSEPGFPGYDRRIITGIRLNFE